MSSWKDEWKTIYQSDSEWLRTKKDGSEPTLEVAEEVGSYEDEDGVEQKKFQLYRFDIERFKFVRDPEDHTKTYLVPEAYNKSSWPHPLSLYEEWFAKKISDVARTVGRDPFELAKAFTSKDPKVRAGAYMDVAANYGPVEFDNYPLELTEPELDERWK